MISLGTTYFNIINFYGGLIFTNVGTATLCGDAELFLLSIRGSKLRREGLEYRKMTA